MKLRIFIFILLLIISFFFDGCKTIDDNKKELMRDFLLHENPSEEINNTIQKIQEKILKELFEK